MGTVEDNDTATSPRSYRRLQRSPNGVNRTYIKVRLSSSERALLEQKARNTGESMSRVLVTAALHRPQSQDLDSADVVQLLETLLSYRRQLFGIATNFNQLAHHANATQEFPPDAQAARTRVLDVVNRIDAVVGSIQR